MGTAVDQVVKTFQKWLYLPKPEALLAVLGTIAANRLSGDPVWLMVVGPPGGGKSEILQSVLGLEDTRGVGTITERALLSGTAKKEVDKDSKGGLLRELGPFGILICKDFGSLLSMHRDERSRTMAALREVYDGSWTRDLGVDGGRKLYWEGKVGMVAGVTPTIDRHHGVMGAMGERFLLLRLPSAEPMAQARKALAHAGHEVEMRAELRESVCELFSSLNGYEPPKNGAMDDQLISLATLVARCRSAVERDGYKRDIELVPDSEAPTRLTVALERLLMGLLSLGISPEQAWNIIVGVGLDSMPKLRRDVIEVLFLAAGEPMKTGAVAEAVRHPTVTTERSLEDLTAHYVVDRHGFGQGNAFTWGLTSWARKGLEQAKTNFSRKVGYTHDSTDTSSSLTSLNKTYDISEEVDFVSQSHESVESNGTGNGTVVLPFIGQEPAAEFVGEEPD